MFKAIACFRPPSRVTVGAYGRSRQQSTIQLARLVPALEPIEFCLGRPKNWLLLVRLRPEHVLHRLLCMQPTNERIQRIHGVA